MDKDYSNYLQFLAAEYNILYIGKDSEEVYDTASSYFLSTSKVDINKEILAKISSILIKRHINLVVIDVKDNNPIAIDFYNAIKALDSKILVMLMLNSKECEKLSEIVPLVNAITFYPISENIFYKKLFALLSCPYAMNSIRRRKIILKHPNIIEDSMDNFFDTYEGSALFIADDLMDMVTNLNDGNLTHQFLINIADKLDEVAEIFSKTKQTNPVVSVYRDLALYLKELELSKVEPKDLKGFTYLAEILRDVSVYLMDMFVDRIFKDVYIFKYSLDSNIKFMQSTLEGRSENESKLDFF